MNILTIILNIEKMVQDIEEKMKKVKKNGKIWTYLLGKKNACIFIIYNIQNENSSKENIV